MQPSSVAFTSMNVYLDTDEYAEAHTTPGSIQCTNTNRAKIILWDSPVDVKVIWISVSWIWLYTKHQSSFLFWKSSASIGLFQFEVYGCRRNYCYMTFFIIMSQNNGCSKARPRWRPKKFCIYNGLGMQTLAVLFKKKNEIDVGHVSVLLPLHTFILRSPLL